jgi:hypothetical protein
MGLKTIRLLLLVAVSFWRMDVERSVNNGSKKHR